MPLSRSKGSENEIRSQESFLSSTHLISQLIGALIGPMAERMGFEPMRAF